MVGEDFSSRVKIDRYERKLLKDTDKKELERYYKIEDGNKEDVDDERDEDEDEEIQQELDRVKTGDENASSAQREGPGSVFDWLPKGSDPIS